MVQTISAGLVIAILVSLIKPFLEARVPRSSTLHDGVIRMAAVVIGVVGFVLQTAVTGTLTAQSAWTSAGNGFLAAVTAIATFHLVTSDYFSLRASTTTLITASPLQPAAPTPEPITPIFPPTT